MNITSVTCDQVGPALRIATQPSIERQSFGRYDLWKTDFIGVAKMRGVGWAICYQDPLSKRLSNHWISLHEVGNVAGFTPILVIDVWEHAFLLDYNVQEKGARILRHRWFPI